MKYFITSCLFVSALVFVWVNYQSHWNKPASEPVRFLGEVVDIIDGDSFKVMTEDGLQRVELHGIDAPEPGQSFGAMSTYYLADLIDGRHVQITKIDVNEYGDLIAEVHIDGLSINRLMLTEGYAWAKRGYFDDKKWAGLESLARKSRLGIWRSGNPVSPWDWRSDQQRG